MASNISIPFISTPIDTSNVPVGVIAGAALGGLFVLQFLFSAVKSGKAVPSTGSWIPFANAWQFFTKRYDFLMSGFARSKSNLIQFNVNQHKVVAMKGDAARAAFFGDKDLSFTEGYRILMGGAPRLEDIDVKGEHIGGGNNDLSWFQRKITFLFRKDRLDALTPLLLADLQKAMNRWPKEGMMNPFENIYDLVFQLTARAATCNEIADDPAQVTKIASLYWKIERGSNPKAMVFPWLPNKQRKEKDAATGELFKMLSDIIDARAAQDGGEKPLDALQVLIDQGDSKGDIVGFILGTMFAGVINSGIIACWVFLFLANNSEWKAKIMAEVMAFDSTYASGFRGPLSERLAQVPPAVWEDEMPVTDAVIRETIRIVLGGSTLRRYVSDKPLEVEGKQIPKGAFLAYPISTLHLDPEVYTNPAKFDPGRFGPGREEDKKRQFAFLGWGVGRHPCLGMRFAKYELKMIISLFLLSFEYEHVDASGNPTKVSSNDIDRNDIFQARPLGEPTFIKYRRTANV